MIWYPRTSRKLINIVLFPYHGSQFDDVRLPTIFWISSFVSCRPKTVIHVWTEIKVIKEFRLFCVNFLFTDYFSFFLSTATVLKIQADNKLKYCTRTTMVVLFINPIMHVYFVVEQNRKWSVSNVNKVLYYSHRKAL